MQQDRFAALIAGLESQGLSQPEIARAAGLSRATVWRFGSGQARSPSYDTVKRLETLYTRTMPDAALRRSSR